MRDEPTQNKTSSDRRVRRRFLKILLGAGGAAVAAAIVQQLKLIPMSGDEQSASKSEAEPELRSDQPNVSDRLDEMASNVVSGGPPPDGIPPIDRPKYISAAEAEKFLKDDDVVFGVNYWGVVKAYPQKILVWHEIVNENFNGQEASVTYCPLTGSAIGFVGKEPRSGAGLTFGTSGRLVNSNLVMYDRKHGADSWWPQILGQAIKPPLKGTRLEEFQVIWTRWGLWKRKYPDTLVLSTETGHIRDYENDPYGSYQRPGNYYDTGGPYFPVTHRSDRFPAKKIVVAVKGKGTVMAIPKLELSKTRVGNTTLEGTPIVAIYDESLKTVRLFIREIEGNALNFEHVGGRIRDRETRTEWTPEGRGVLGKLADVQLKPINSWEVMWFAWYAFYPNTLVYE